MSRLVVLKFTSNEVNAIYGITLAVLSKLCEIEFHRIPDEATKARFVKGELQPQHLMPEEENVFQSTKEVLSQIQHQKVAGTPSFTQDSWGQTRFTCNVLREEIDCDEDILHHFIKVRDEARIRIEYWGTEFDKVEQILAEMTATPRKRRRVR